MSLRGVLKRSWRRLDVECRLRRSVVEGIALLMVVQAMVALCAFSLWGQGVEEEKDVPSRVGQYVVLFNVEASPTQGLRQRTASRAEQEPRKEDLLMRDDESKSYEDKGEWLEEKEEEVDPILGRGQEDEFVTYRSTDRGALPEESGDYKFRTYDSNHQNVFRLKHDTRKYFEEMGRGRFCFVGGTDRSKTERSSSDSCKCLVGYFGVDCGIPEAAWHGFFKSRYPDTKLRPRDVPRRLVNGLTVNHEFAMFEARIHELHGVVDAFLVAESNYTTHGDPKGFHLLDMLRGGYLRAFQEKIVYVGMGFFPLLSRGDGWMADAYLRFYMGEKGLPLLQGLREDDLFVLSDSDELPTREILTFLKVYDGYPEPISFGLRWNMFGFFWLEPAQDTFLNWLKGEGEQLAIVTSVTTVGMLRKVYMNNVFYIRKKNLWQYYKLSKELRRYREEGHLVKEWVAGTVGHYAGWHCSWCFSPSDILRKMDSAQANDKPRWGDFPEKRNLSYISSRIREGIWFDDKKRFLPVKNTEDPYYAPRYLMDHPQQYQSILFHPDHPVNLSESWVSP